MSFPIIKGYKILTEIGSGAAGSVYEARSDDGVSVAIKVFDTIASNPGLIKNRIERLTEHGAQHATVPILAERLNIRPSCLVMPLLAEAQDEKGGYITQTLQSYLGDYIKTERSWGMVFKLAERLAALHTARVAHGNLKPGNIFLNEEGDPLLADYASGLMPEVHHLSYNDALLYASPEQLKDPSSYLEEAGYRWDVYAFGVLAFRLLTGSFPRCQETFISACPVTGDQKNSSVEVEHEKIAAGLEQDERLPWPTDPIDQREERCREMIDFCLMLDPQGRPADMREVSRRFGKIDFELQDEALRFSLIDQRKNAEKRRDMAMMITAAFAVLSCGLAGMWALTQYWRGSEELLAAQKFNDYESNSLLIIKSLESDVAAASVAEIKATNLSSSLREALQNEQKNSLSELRAAHLNSERLMRWVLEKGVLGLPTLQRREGRLAVLAEEIEEQIAGLEKRPGLEKELALLCYRLAEVELACGEDEKGERSLQRAVTLGQNDLSNTHQVEVTLRLYLLRSLKQKAITPEQLGSLEVLIKKNWPKGGDVNLRFTAALNLIKGRQAELDGESSVALKAYANSLKNYEELCERYPETPAIRMGLGHAYQEVALVAEGAGDIANTAELRGKAAEAFQKLASSLKTKSLELEFQMVSAKAAQAIAAWKSGRSFTAEKMAREGITKLISIQNQMPNDFRVATTLASQQGIIATVLRDQGQSTQAATLLSRSISALESGLKKEGSNWNARYLLASLKWQLSGIYGQKGQRIEEVRLGTEARDQLKLILDAGVRAPHPNRVKVELAYLCGDLGHSTDLRGKRSLGIAFLRESKAYWEEIVAAHPKSPEAREGIQWVTERLRQLGEK